jgi:excisionase family DNA binding protein
MPCAAPPLAGTLDIDEVVALVGVSRDTIMRRVGDGRFPAPLPLGRVKRWSRAVVEGWLRSGGTVGNERARPVTAAKG